MLSLLIQAGGRDISPKTGAKVARSTTAYGKLEIVERDTEAVSLRDPENNLVMEVTPYPGLGLAQVVMMTPDQSRKVAEYTLKQSGVLRELGRTDLLLDITYVPERNWSKASLRRIPAGTAVFPVLDVRTVPLEQVKRYLT